MIILMTFLEKLEDFENTTNTLIEKISTNQVFFITSYELSKNGLKIALAPVV